MHATRPWTSAHGARFLALYVSAALTSSIYLPARLLSHRVTSEREPPEDALLSADPEGGDDNGWSSAVVVARCWFRRRLPRLFFDPSSPSLGVAAAVLATVEALAGGAAPRDALPRPFSAAVLLPAVGESHPFCRRLGSFIGPNDVVLAAPVAFASPRFTIPPP